MADTKELFGSADQVQLLRRATSLWSLLKNNPRYSSYGRMVSLTVPETDAVDQATALARLQGATSCQYYPAADAERFCGELAGLGMSASLYEQCCGGEAAFAASRQLLAENELPDDLTVSGIDADTPAPLVADLAQLSISCGVMPVPGPVMRGQTRDGICLVATDRDGKAVATASSYMSHHPDHPHSKDAFWGMLATRPDRRGQKIALVLGAQAIAWMWETHAARGFITGIQPTNASSMALCGKLAITPSGWAFIGCIDPETFGDAKITQ